MGKQKRGECAYCGRVTEVTRDHVIPECLFVPPYPPNLITVPACKECNHAKSHNDDFLRDWLTIDIYGSQSPAAQEIFRGKVARSVEKGHSKIVRRFLVEAQVKSIVTKSGRYLGDLPVLSLDEEQVETIISPIVRGLYFHEHKVRMPVGLAYEFRRYHPFEYDAVWELFQRFEAPPLRKLGSIFGYTSVQFSEPVFGSYWLLIFYDHAILTVWASAPTAKAQESGE